MKTLQLILIAIIAFEHFYFLVLEMFLWTKPQGLKAFGFKKEFAEETKVLAANQGLYNGFLSAGLIWSLIEKDSNTAYTFSVFFLSCVLVAGLYGAYSTQKMKLFFIQGVPALIALPLIILFR